MPEDLLAKQEERAVEPVASSPQPASEPQYEKGIFGRIQRRAGSIDLPDESTAYEYYKDNFVKPYTKTGAEFVDPSAFYTDHIPEDIKGIYADAGKGFKMGQFLRGQWQRDLGLFQVVAANIKEKAEQNQLQLDPEIYNLKGIELGDFTKIDVAGMSSVQLRAEGERNLNDGMHKIETGDMQNAYGGEAPWYAQVAEAGIDLVAHQLPLMVMASAGLALATTTVGPVGAAGIGVAARSAGGVALRKTLANSAARGALSSKLALKAYKAGSSVSVAQLGGVSGVSTMQNSYDAYYHTYNKTSSVEAGLASFSDKAAAIAGPITVLNLLIGAQGLVFNKAGSVLTQRAAKKIQDRLLVAGVAENRMVGIFPSVAQKLGIGAGVGFVAEGLQEGFEEVISASWNERVLGTDENYIEIFKQAFIVGGVLGAGMGGIGGALSRNDINTILDPINEARVEVAKHQFPRATATAKDIDTKRKLGQGGNKDITNLVNHLKAVYAVNKKGQAFDYETVYEILSERQNQISTITSLFDGVFKDEELGLSEASLEKRYGDAYKHSENQELFLLEQADEALDNNDGEGLGFALLNAYRKMDVGLRQSDIYKEKIKKVVLGEGVGEVKDLLRGELSENDNKFLIEVRETYKETADKEGFAEIIKNTERSYTKPDNAELYEAFFSKDAPSEQESAAELSGVDKQWNDILDSGLLKSEMLAGLPSVDIIKDAGVKERAQQAVASLKEVEGDAAAGPDKFKPADAPVKVIDEKTLKGHPIPKQEASKEAPSEAEAATEQLSEPSELLRKKMPVDKADYIAKALEDKKIKEGVEFENRDDFFIISRDKKDMPAVFGFEGRKADYGGISYYSNEDGTKEAYEVLVVDSSVNPPKAEVRYGSENLDDAITVLAEDIRPNIKSASKTPQPKQEDKEVEQARSKEPAKPKGEEQAQEEDKRDEKGEWGFLKKIDAKKSDWKLPQGTEAKKDVAEQPQEKKVEDKKPAEHREETASYAWRGKNWKKALDIGEWIELYNEDNPYKVEINKHLARRAALDNQLESGYEKDGKTKLTEASIKKIEGSITRINNTLYAQHTYFEEINSPYYKDVSATPIEWYRKAKEDYREKQVPATEEDTDATREEPPAVNNIEETGDAQQDFTNAYEQGLMKAVADGKPLNEGAMRVRLAKQYKLDVKSEIVFLLAGIARINAAYTNPDIRAALVADDIYSGGSDGGRRAMQSVNQFFPTPLIVSEVMTKILNAGEQDVVLEPSAGLGNLLVFMQNTPIIYNEKEATILRLMKEYSKLPIKQFTDYDGTKLSAASDIEGAGISRIIMNPPFSKNVHKRKGGTDTQGVSGAHIRQALSVMRSGRLVALTGSNFKGDTLYKALDSKLIAELTLGAAIYKKYGVSGLDGFKIWVIDKSYGAESNKDDVIKQEFSSVAEIDAFVDTLPKVPETIRAAKPRDPTAVLDAVEEEVATQADVESKRHKKIRDDITFKNDNFMRAGSDRKYKRLKADKLEEEISRQQAISDKAEVAKSEVATERRIKPKKTKSIFDETSAKQGARKGGSRTELNAKVRAIATTASKAWKVFTHPVPIVIPRYQRNSATVTPDFDSFEKAHPIIKEFAEDGQISVEQTYPVVSAWQRSQQTTLLPYSSSDFEFIRQFLPKKHQQWVDSLQRDATEDIVDGKTISYIKTVLGFMYGDGMGFGKSRTIAANALGAINEGKNVLLVVPVASIEKKRASKAEDDMDLEQDSYEKNVADRMIEMGDGKFFKQADFINYNDFKKPTQSLPKSAGKRGKILLFPYSLASSWKGKRGPVHAHKLTEWLGEGFDGLMAFDEAHKMGMAHKSKNNKDFFSGQISATGQFFEALQAIYPKAPVVYASGTWADKLGLLTSFPRLGLWGSDSPYTTRDDMLDILAKMGTQAGEMVAKEIYSQGALSSWDLGYADTTYEYVKAPLSSNSNQLLHEIVSIIAAIYDTGKDVADEVAERIGTTAIQDANFTSDEIAVKVGKLILNRGAFEGSILRIMRNMSFLFSVPKAVEDAVKKIEGKAIGKDGKAISPGAAVFYTDATMEAEIKHAKQRDIALRSDYADLKGYLEAGSLSKEDFAAQIKARGLSLIAAGLPPSRTIDTSLKGALIRMIEQYIPIHDFVRDEDGKITKQTARGQVVVNEFAVQKRKKLIASLDKYNFPNLGPLDYLHQQMERAGHTVAEITGRKERLVEQDDGTIKIVKRSETNNQAREKFQLGEYKAIVLSRAGSTAIDLHATAENPLLRNFYLMDPGWSVKDIMQGFGRVNRTGQVKHPNYILVETDIPGQMRILSAVAAKLESLGSFVKGSGEAAKEMVLDPDKYIITDDYGAQAVNIVLNQIMYDKGIMKSDPVLKEIANKELINLLRFNVEYVEEMGGKKDVSVSPNQMFNKILSMPTKYAKALLDNIVETRIGLIAKDKEEGKYKSAVGERPNLISAELQDDIEITDEDGNHLGDLLTVLAEVRRISKGWEESEAEYSNANFNQHNPYYISRDYVDTKNKLVRSEVFLVQQSLEQKENKEYKLMSPDVMKSRKYEEKDLLHNVDKHIQVPDNKGVNKSTKVRQLVKEVPLGEAKELWEQQLERLGGTVTQQEMWVEGDLYKILPALIEGEENKGGRKEAYLTDIVRNGRKEGIYYLNLTLKDAGILGEKFGLDMISKASAQQLPLYLKEHPHKSGIAADGTIINYSQDMNVWAIHKGGALVNAVGTAKELRDYMKERYGAEAAFRDAGDNAIDQSIKERLANYKKKEQFNIDDFDVRVAERHAQRKAINLVNDEGGVYMMSAAGAQKNEVYIFRPDLGVWDFGSANNFAEEDLTAGSPIKSLKWYEVGADFFDKTAEQIFSKIKTEDADIIPENFMAMLMKMATHQDNRHRYKLILPNGDNIWYDGGEYNIYKKDTGEIKVVGHIGKVESEYLAVDSGKEKFKFKGRDFYWVKKEAGEVVERQEVFSLKIDSSLPEALRHKRRLAIEAAKLGQELGVDIELISRKVAPTGVKKGGKVKAFYNRDTGKIAVVLDNLIKVVDMRQAVFHEAFGHRGLAIMRANGQNIDGRLLMLLNSNDVRVQNIIRQVRDLYPISLTQVEIAEEVVARVAESTEPSPIKELINEIILWVKQSLRLTSSYESILSLLRDSRRALKRTKVAMLPRLDYSGLDRALTTGLTAALELRDNLGTAIQMGGGIMFIQNKLGSPLASINQKKEVSYFSGRKPSVADISLVNDAKGSYDILQQIRKNTAEDVARHIEELVAGDFADENYVSYVLSAGQAILDGEKMPDYAGDTEKTKDWVSPRPTYVNNDRFVKRWENYVRSRYPSLNIRFISNPQPADFGTMNVYGASINANSLHNYQHGTDIIDMVAARYDLGAVLGKLEIYKHLSQDAQGRELVQQYLIKDDVWVENNVATLVGSRTKARDILNMATKHSDKIAHSLTINEQREEDVRNDTLTVKDALEHMKYEEQAEQAVGKIIGGMSQALNNWMSPVDKWWDSISKEAKELAGLTVTVSSIESQTREEAQSANAGFEARVFEASKLFNKDVMNYIKGELDKSEIYPDDYNQVSKKAREQLEETGELSARQRNYERTIAYNYMALIYYANHTVKINETVRVKVFQLKQRRRKLEANLLGLDKLAANNVQNEISDIEGMEATYAGLAKTGMKLAVAKQIDGLVNDSPAGKNITKALAIFKRGTDASLDSLVDNEIFTTEEAEQYKGTYDIYLTLGGAEKDKVDYIERTSVPIDITKHRQGRSEPAWNVLDATANTIRYQNNQVRRHLVMAEVGKMVTAQIIFDGEKQKFFGSDYKYKRSPAKHLSAAEYFELNTSEREKVFIYMRHSEKKHLLVASKGLAQSLDFVLNVKDYRASFAVSKFLISSMNYVRQVMAMTATVLAPAFIFGNMVRDATDTLVSYKGILEREGYDADEVTNKDFAADYKRGVQIMYWLTNRSSEQFRIDFLKDEIDWTNLAKYGEGFATRGRELGLENIQDFIDMYRRGGLTGIIHSLGNQQKVMAKYNRRMARAGMREGWSNLIAYWDDMSEAMNKPFNYWANLNTSFEYAPRYAIYKAAMRQKPQAIREAMRLSQNITVNFSQRGRWTSGKGLGAVYFGNMELFIRVGLNATHRFLTFILTMQNLNSAYAYARQNKWKAAGAQLLHKRLLKTFFKSFMLLLIHSLSLRMSCNTRDKRTAYAENRTLSFCGNSAIPLGRLLSLPKFFADIMGDTIAQAAGQDISPPSRIEQFLSAIESSFSPFALGGYGSAPLWAIKTVLPVGPLELLGEAFAANKNFFGGNIHQAEAQWNIHRKKSAKGFRTTPAGWHSFAKMMDALGIDTYPESWRHTIHYFGNGLTRAIETAAIGISDKVKRSDLLSTIPDSFLFFFTDKSQNTRVYLNYREKEDKIIGDYRIFNDARKVKDTETMQLIRQDNPTFIKDYRLWNKLTRAYYKPRSMDEKLSTQQKRVQIKAMRQKVLDEFARRSDGK